MTGEELRALRKTLKLTQSQMAEKLGITLSAIYKLESGENNMSKRTEKLLHYVEMESKLQEY